MSRAYRYLSYEDRQQIELMWAGGARPKDIAYEIGVHTASIYNELKRGQDGRIDGNQRLAYDASLAERRIQEGFKRRGGRKHKIG